MKSHFFTDTHWQKYWTTMYKCLLNKNSYWGRNLAWFSKFLQFHVFHLISILLFPPRLPSEARVCVCVCVCVCVHARSLQPCLTLCDTMNCSLPGSSIQGISPARMLSGLPCPPPGDLPDPGIEILSLTSPVLADGFFITSATWEAHVQT